MTSVQPQTIIGGRYQVSATLAQGAGCLVLRGEDTVLKREVAIKLVPPEQSAPYRAGLGATARIGHPAFVGIFDSLDHDGQLVIVQELIKGQAFADLAWGVLTPLAITKFGRQLALALAHAHRQGIAHGDLTPTALFRDQWGAARINNILLPPDLGYFAAAGRILTRQDDWQPIQPTPRDDLRAVGAALWLLLGGFAAPPEGLTGTAQDWDIIPRAVPAPLRTVVEQLVIPDHPQALADAETLIDALGACLHALDADKAHRNQLPPWERPAAHFPLPPQRKPSTPIKRPQAEPTGVPTVESPAAVTVPAAAQPAPAPVYPMFVGPTPPRPTDDDATWLSREGAALQHLAQPGSIKPAAPPPAPRKLDVALWVSLAIALFLFWLVIGYLVPGLFGR